MFEISLGVGDRALQHIQIVVQCIELAACGDELALAERQVVRSLASHPVPLTASLRAELLRPTRTGALGQRMSAPTAPHDLDRPPLSIAG